MQEKAMTMHEEDSNETTLFLTFKVGGELLAFDVSRVREVQDLCPITRVPRTPEYMRGVINLRGAVIPVVDLRQKFGMSRTKSSIETRIVIIEFEMGGNLTVAGMLTESVHDVIGISEDQISPPPESGTRWRTEYISGIGKYAEDFILMLDVGRVFNDQENMSVIA